MVSWWLQDVPLFLFLIWVLWKGDSLRTVGFLSAVNYWVQKEYHDGGSMIYDDLIVRYLQEVYGSRPSQTHRILLILGIGGILLTATILFVGLWHVIHGPVPEWAWWSVWITAISLLLLLPVLRWTRWRSYPLHARKTHAVGRIFGGTLAAQACVQSLLDRIPREGSKLSIWAFPLASSGADRIVRIAFWACIATTYLHFLGNWTGFLTAVVSLVAFFALPSTISGFLLAFGEWRTVPDMNYPVAIFLEEMWKND
ncbi:hypothetical protein B1757_02340 [Acidithiobacillus marinus]|uniref:Uncharacterized protein n=1 Tax=Acidithiobacillus marinus TaxID=187490 RepID=A0A2I1DPN7_9PROT|nr:hypothetical protein [Acidithiobacillus marinus]PKY11820.1 hypothetical protein B1757_02340 [Acidithiobacillus marinus]